MTNLPMTPIQTESEIVNLYQTIEGRGPNEVELISAEQELAAGIPLRTLRATLATSPEVQQILVNAYYSVYGSTLTTLSTQEAELASGTSLRDVEAPWLTEADDKVSAVIQQMTGTDPDDSVSVNISNVSTDPFAFCDSNEVIGYPEFAGLGQSLLQGVPLDTIRTLFASSWPAEQDLICTYLTIYGESIPSDLLSTSQNEIVAGQALSDVEETWSVTNLYQSVLERNPSADELSASAGILGGGTSLTSLRVTLAASNEARLDLTNTYQSIYDQPIPVSELSTDEAALVGGASLKHIEAQTQITALYREIDGRDPDAAGLAAWTGQLVAGISLTAIRTAFATCSEVQQDLTATYGQPLSTSQLADCQNLLTGGETLSEVDANLNDATLLTKEYVSVLGSGPGLTTWMNNLFTAEAPNQVLLDFASTTAATNLLSGLCQAATGKLPTSTQLTQAEGLLASGASQPEITAAFLPPVSGPPTVWLVPNSPVIQQLMGKTATQDFMNICIPGAPGAEATNPSVFEIPEQEVIWGTDSELEAIFSYLNANHIALAMAGLMLPQGPNNIGVGVEGFNASPGYLGQVAARIKSLGGNLQYIDMDGPLGGGHQSTATNAPQWSIAEVAQQVAVNVAAAEAVFPTVQVGDTESVPGTDDIMEFAQDYQEATGQPLAFFNADVQWSASWQVPLENLAESLRTAGIGFNVIFTGDPETTSAGWTQLAMERMAAVETDPLLQPGAGVVSTWSEYPTNLLPDNDPSTLSYLGLEYTNIAPLFRDGTLSQLANDAPLIAAPTDISAGLGVATPLPGLTVGLDGSTPVTTTVAVMVTDSTGLLYASGMTGITGNGTTSITISGSVQQVDLTLGNLLYVGRTPGTDMVQVTGIDGTGAPAQQTISLSVGQIVPQLQSATMQLPTQMEFIGGSAVTVLQGTGAPDVFDVTSDTSTFTQIMLFDPRQDVIEVSRAAITDFSSLEQNMTAAVGGALIDLSGGHTLLVDGTSPSCLRSANFTFV